MKALLILFLLLPFLAKGEDVKLLTWNVFMLPKPVNFTKQRERIRLIAEELAKVDHDIILLQEAFIGSFRKEIGEKLKDRYPHQVHLPRSRKLFDFLNSGLFILSKHPFEVLGHHYFRSCNHADCFASKGVILVEITTRRGKKFQLATTHLQAWEDNEARNVRVTQIEEIRELLDTHARSGIPQILAGDLNIDGHLTLEYPAALKTLGMTSTPLEGVLTSTNGYKVECYKTPGKENGGEWIDHVWLKSMGTETAILEKKARPFKALFSSGKECMLSDHYSVESIIRL